MMPKFYFKQNSGVNFRKWLTMQDRTLDQTARNYRKSNQFQGINLSFCSNVLKFSAKEGFSLEGKQIHSPMIKLGYCNVLSLHNQLLSFYVKCNESSEACKLFDEMPVRNVVTWNTLIRDCHLGFCYFRRMLLEGVKIDRITFLNLLCLSLEIGKIEMGKQFHCCIVKLGFYKDCYLNSSLVNFYAKLGFVQESRWVFDDVLEKDLVLWNVMVSCYALNGLIEDGFRVFRMMQLEGVKGDDFTYTSLVNSCASLAYRKLGKQIHGVVLRFGFDQDLVVASALTDMYVKNEIITHARKVFDEMPHRNLISWNAMIVGYGRFSDGKEATKLLMEMLREGFRPDELTLASVVSSCGNGETLQVHSYALKVGNLLFLSVSNALINGYSKSGNLVSAFELFSSIDRPDIVSYTCMIQAYAFHGLSRNAIELFKIFVSNGAPKPDKIMFLEVLSACSHGGLVTEGLHFFELMTIDYRIEPEVEHYTCLVDLLGRAGLLAEAHRVMVSMPTIPGPDTLGAFIGACKVHGNLELAKWAAEKLFLLEPDKNVNYALMANAFAYSGKWFELAEIRKTMRDNCGLKIPGFSWLDHLQP
ncbi:pentatricopeptide repeat-containing protein At2g46050, mitochondrial [Cynara cardunculus var. scolymus]|uniref:pentatricopeptide repeat-containing protein At2g46050, mitochondrial n=1 Tax=Cynara cardunculus var. scolymus TaxID=59895 RepID=UPI000D630778|nr:pentatricopeptide repeat-containing protein At2g46050, mitochondrial [Cynara cardunculus var. scolymus]